MLSDSLRLVDEYIGRQLYFYTVDKAISDGGLVFSFSTKEKENITKYLTVKNFTNNKLYLTSYMYF